MKYTKEFKEEVKAWYFSNGEKVSETARHFSIKMYQVCRWRDEEKAREKSRLYDKSEKRREYLNKHREERNAYSRAYRQTSAGKEAELRANLKKRAKILDKQATLKDYKIPFLDKQISDLGFIYDNINWYIGQNGYLVSRHNIYHRYIYAKFILKGNEIPSGWEIHHIDCNKFNNSLDNLICIPEAVHHQLHKLNREGNKERYNNVINQYKSLAKDFYILDD